MPRFKAIQSWERSYSPALSVKEGEGVTVGTRDEQWSEWIWCTNSSGLGGWLPASSLSSQKPGEIAIVQMAFDTRELTVSSGELFEGFGERSGWMWCRNDTGAEGWVPSDHLESI